MINLKKFSRDKVKSIFRKSINLKVKNHSKIKNKRIFLSKLVNDFLKDNSSKDLRLFYSDRMEKTGPKITTSVSIDKENMPKIVGVNLTYLVNELIEKIK